MTKTIKGLQAKFDLGLCHLFGSGVMPLDSLKKIPVKIYFS
jgi:hypothetical protein